MTAYYNEIEPFCVQWLKNLISKNLIAPGDVDERSIVDVQPDDLRGYEQCHFFAGIGGWSYALRLAGWPDDRPVWTGSCPCQPFSTAGKQRGSEDERHLWPAFFRLIRECRPSVVFGEQVAGAAGLAWLDHVCADLEDAGYAAAAADLPACSVGAPHRRQRLFWVADLHLGRCHGKPIRLRERRPLAASAEAAWGRAVGGMGDADDAGLEGWRDESGECAGQFAAGPASPSGMEHSAGERRQMPLQQSRHGKESEAEWQADRDRSRGAFNPWADLEWLPCADGKSRPTQRGLFPLAHGIPSRVGRLRAYGNAIVPQVAAEWIGAVMDCIP